MRVTLGKACSYLMLFCLLSAGAVSSGSNEDAPVGLLPGAGEVAGWRTDGDPLVFYPHNLWEYIDGAAEGFLAYDFRSVAAQDFVNVEGGELKVEIYEHGSPLMAFGIYSQFRDPEFTYYEIGNEGFGDAYSLHFWKGAYYVKINVFDESDFLEASMRDFAEKISMKIEDDTGFPEETACFPADGLVDKSVMYVTEGVLGRAKFPPAFIAGYRFGEEEGSLYLMRPGDAESARELFDWYSKEIGAAAEERESKHGAFVTALGEEKYRGEVLVFQFRGWLGVVTGFSEPERLVENLVEGTLAGIAALEDGPVE